MVKWRFNKKWLILLGLPLTLIGFLFVIFIQYKEQLLNRHIDNLLLDRSQLSVELGQVISGDWNRVCFIKGNYNVMTQVELDHILGVPNLIDISELLFDGNEIYVVTFSSKPKVQRYSSIRMLNKEFTVCSEQPNQFVTLYNDKEGIVAIQL